jgi:hypothetical protein
MRIAETPGSRANRGDDDPCARPSGGLHLEEVIRSRFPINSRNFEHLQHKQNVPRPKLENLYDGNNGTYYGNLAFTQKFMVNL